MKVYFEELLFVFPSEPVPKGPYLSFSESGEGHDVTKEFLGRKWTELEYEVCLINYDALGWFMPEAYVYYVPAFMNVAFHDQSNSGVKLFCCELVRDWHHSNNAEIEQNMCERVELMTIEQLDIWDKWLHRLELLRPKYLLSNEIPDARIGVAEWRKWKLDRLQLQ